MATCSEIQCNTGYLDLETLLLNLFAVDENGCVGLKLGLIIGSDCTNFTDLASCGSVTTLEQALNMAVVDDGCGGWALGTFFVYPTEEEGPEPQ